MTIFDLASRIKRIANAPGEITFQPLHYVDVELRIPDVHKAREILGFDLLNEPIAPYHDVSLLNGRLEPFYKRLTQAIRAVDPGRIVLLNGSEWSANFEVFGPPFAPNLAYTYHSFWSSTERDSIQRHLNFAALYEVPTKRFNEAVKRNLAKFPADFMFTLTAEEWSVLRSQSATLNAAGTGRGQRPQVRASRLRGA